MRIIFLITFLVLTISIFSQHYELPKMKKYTLERCIWPDTITQNQKKYWNNGNIKVEYENTGGDRKIRKEYFENGKLKLRVELKQECLKDTFYVTSPETGEVKIKVKSYCVDVLDGKYIEYLNQTNVESEAPITIGQYSNNKMFGVWKSVIGKYNSAVKATFNKDGNLDGEFIQFYSSYNRPDQKIMWKGQFGLENISMETIDPETGKIIRKEFMNNKPIGTWYLYDISGNVIGQVTYKWN